MNGLFNQGDRPRPAEILVHGNSGCSVSVANLNGRTTVLKSAIDAGYSDRLKRQIDKQIACRIQNKLPFVRIPAVLSRAEHEGLYHAHMEYVFFHNSIDFFAGASRSFVDSVATMVFAYIDEEIDHSALEEVPIKAICEKITSITEAIKSHGSEEVYRLAMDKIKAAIDRRHSLFLPIGRCHGDLTFSNIMIARDASAIALIDFLDSFIESPIMDIAKLRQDTLFHWTLLMSDNVEDSIRFRQIMEYLDRKILARYAVHRWYKENADLVLGLNVLRIAPYARTPNIQRFIVDSIASLRLP